MTGIFNANPPLSKHTFIWDMEVLKYLGSMKSNEKFSDRFLVLTLTVLLSLTSAGKGHQIAYIT